jgi:predicted Fe-S protein YdhL (DUF1289 family)
MRCKDLLQPVYTALLGDMSRADILTPCVKVCFVDPKVDQCVGCFRTLEELGRWTHYTDTERDAIMASLPEREQAYANRKNGLA